MKTKYSSKEDVIEHLKNGCEIYTRKNEHHGKEGQLIYSSRTWEISNCKDINVFIHHSTITSLMNDNIIMKERPYSLIINK